MGLSESVWLGSRHAGVAGPPRSPWLIPRRSRPARLGRCRHRRRVAPTTRWT